MSPMNQLRLVVFICSLALATGCTTMDTAGVKRSYSFGLTVITFPHAEPKTEFSVKEVATAGISLGGGSLGIGYTKQKAALLPPESAIYVEVQNKQQFEAICRLIHQYPDKKICVSQKTSQKSLAGQ